MLLACVMGYEVAIDGRFLRVVQPRIQYRKFAYDESDQKIQLPIIPKNILQHFFDPSFTGRILE